VLNVLCSLSLAVALALGLNELARRHVTTGLVLLVCVVLLRWLASAVANEWGDRAARTVRDRWRSQMVTHLRRPRVEGQRSRGDITVAIEHAADGPSLAMLATSARISVVGLAVVFWSVGWLSTVITLGLMGLAVPLYQRAGTRSEKLAVEYRQRRALLEARQLELLHHSPELRALGAIDYGANEIAAISTSENTIALRAIRVALESSLVTEFLSGVSVGLVAMVVGFSLLDGRLSLVRALIAVFVTSDIFVHIRRFGSEFHRREDATKSLELLTVVPERGPFVNVARTQLLHVADLVTTASATPVTFDVSRGDRVLVSGPSGSGKTTLLQTLVGWRLAIEGTSDLAALHIGYVSVESTLMSGSIRDNVALGRNVTRDNVRSLLDQLGLRGDRFSDIDTLLLADGRGLSSGERVRLVLARSLIGSIDILILDDVAGVMDEMTRTAVKNFLMARNDIAVIEATVDSPLISAATTRIELDA
jgi:ABC-type transport system involved in cytochrome bd biosynthesis fused ATPase/permease subunit